MKPTRNTARNTTKLDNLKRAQKKNIVEKSHLQSELKSIDREKLIQMRLDKYERQQFKNKYGALMYDALDENKGSEPSDVVMYETHCPGFCYRRNGECRIQPATIINSSVNMQDLHILLFTKGEIDIDKVVCLYLLTAHLCDTLRPPPNSQRATFLTRQHSPLERLVDRSKRRYAENKLSRFMPLYTLVTEFPDCGCSQRPPMDPRLAGRVIVNTKILQIIESVRNALDKSNSMMFSKIIEMGCNIQKMMEMIRKPKMLKFYAALYGQNIISSCESFQLEIIHSDIIEIPIEVEQFANLVKVIRSNVLLIPNSDTWKAPPPATDLANEDELDDCEKNELTNICKEVDEPSVAPVVAAEEADDKDLDYHNCAKTTNTDFVLDIEIEEGGRKSAATVPQMQPKILKNFQLGFSEIGIGTESLNQNRVFIRIDDSTTFHELATLLTKKVRKESRLEHHDSVADLNQPSEIEILEAQLAHEIAQLTSSSCHQRAAKQLTCYACMQRWATPLPVPKISKILKGVLPQLKDTSYFSSRSAQYISTVIDERIKKFQEYDDSKDKVVISNRMVKKMAKGNLLADTSIEIVNLDELELAKIRQEIKEIETRKKLQKYLDRSDISKKGKLKHKRVH